MLHPGVGGHDEVPGQPGAQEQHQRGKPLQAAAESILTEQQQAQERRLQEEREHPFHRQGLPDDSPGVIGELRPVRAELKFQRNAGHDAKGKTQREDAGPEPGHVMKMIVGTQQIPGPQIDQQQGQAHRQLRKEIVKGGGNGKLQPVVK